MMARSHNTLQSEAGYIDVRPQSRQIDENLLRRTAGPYIRVKNGGAARAASWQQYRQQRKCPYDTGTGALAVRFDGSVRSGNRHGE